jgi:hypothetical protein
MGIVDISLSEDGFTGYASDDSQMGDHHLTLVSAYGILPRN